MPEPKLKPCPFCGGKAVMVRSHGGGRRRRLVGCSNNECLVSPAVTGETNAAAVLLWNTRKGERDA